MLRVKVSKRITSIVGFGGRGTLACDRGGGRGSEFQRGDIHCGTLGIYVLCGELVPV